MWETGPLEHFGKRALAWEAMRDEHGKWVLRPSDRPRPPEGRITVCCLCKAGPMALWCMPKCNQNDQHK